MRSHRRNHRSKWAHCNTPEALRRRRAAADARREAMAATPPAPTGPEPGSLWQTITLRLFVPTQGRCDQHAVEIDGERIGLLSATQLGVAVRERVYKRPSLDVLAETRSSLLA